MDQIRCSEQFSTLAFKSLHTKSTNRLVNVSPRDSFLTVLDEMTHLSDRLKSFEALLNDMVQGSFYSASLIVSIAI